jgi:hypothetical protein
VTARRRFNDLVALHETLKLTFRGSVIPFRPGKTIANSTVLRTHKDTFLKDRAYAIKCYLVKISSHPEIRVSAVRAAPRFVCFYVILEQPCWACASLGGLRGHCLRDLSQSSMQYCKRRAAAIYGHRLSAAFL